MAAAASFANTVANRLLLWSAASMASGLPMVASDKPLLRGLGQQFLAWGAIDGAIALGGRWSTRRKAGHSADQGEVVKLQRLLLINAGLDVLYITGGVALAMRRGREDPYWLGHGLGILAQGGFLLAFDLWHGLNAPVAP
jgi:hypothetical protein